MRLALTVLGALLLTPASAQAATVAREGSELVYRSAPGQEDLVVAEGQDEAIFHSTEGGDAELRAGAGCAGSGKRVSCALAGVTAVRFLAGDQSDNIGVILDLPVFADLGPGDDEFDGRTPSLSLTAGAGSDRAGVESRAVALDMGPGEDYVDGSIPSGFTGPFTAEGGAGRDLMSLIGASGPGIALSGGPGDDELHVQTTPGPPVEITCGPGADRWSANAGDHAGEGCAPSLAITGVSRNWLTGRLSAPGRGTIAVRRRTRPHRLLARGSFRQPAGALRARLHRTAVKVPKAVSVTVRTRAGADRGDLFFETRLG